MKDDYILIVDDELPIREMIHTSLDMAGFQCLQAEDAKQAHQMIVDQRPALILLDWMMPGGVSGVDLCRRLKRDENLSEIPVIMLTARGEEDHKVQGLDAGADDYMTKPFSTRELVSRIKAVLRRANALSGEKSIDANGLILDPVSQRVSFGNNFLDMGPTEYRLLAFFMTHPERPTPVHNFLTKSGAETCILKTVPLTCIFAVYVKCLSLMRRIALCKQFGVQAIDSLHVRISP